MKIAKFRAFSLAFTFATALVCMTAGMTVATAHADARADDTGAPLPLGMASPKVYVFPLSGQMGTDISMPIVQTLIEDVKKQKPDILVLKLKSADIDRINHLRNDNPVEFGLVGEITNYRDMVDKIHQDLSSIPQVMWIEDSVGVSGLVGLAWERMYMSSDARLGGQRPYR